MVKVWALVTGDVRFERSVHQSSIDAPDISQDGRLAATCSEGEAVIWDLATGKDRARVRADRLTFPSDRTLVVARGKDAIEAWSLESRDPRLTAKARCTSTIREICQRPGMQAVVVSSDFAPLATWDLSSAEMHPLPVEHRHWSNSLAVSSDGKLLFSGGADGFLGVWDFDANVLRHWLRTTEAAVFGLAVDARCRRAVTGHNDGRIVVWDLQKGTQIASFVGEGTMHSCVMTADGTTVAAGDSAGFVRILRVESVMSKLSAESFKLPLGSNS